MCVSIPDGDAWVFKVSMECLEVISTIVSIPDGDAWVFKGEFNSRSAIPAQNVSIPDGDAWVFKAEPLKLLAVHQG